MNKDQKFMTMICVSILFILLLGVSGYYPLGVSSSEHVFISDSGWVFEKQAAVSFLVVFLEVFLMWLFLFVVCLFSLKGVKDESKTD